MFSVEIDANIDAEVGRKVEQGIYEYLQEGADRGFAEMTERAPVDRGNLLQNMFSPEVDGQKVVYGVRDVPYARPMEFGTTSFQPPLQPLLEWSQRVSGGKGLGYYVALHKIPEEGIDAQPYARPARDKQASWYNSHDIDSYVSDSLR